MKQLQDVIKFGKWWLLANSDLLDGINHLPCICTIGPDPKVICTSATLHSLAIEQDATFNDLQGCYSHAAGAVRKVIM